MRKTKYTVKYTTSFKKDYKRAIRRGLKIELLEQVVALLAMGEPLPEKNRDHDLSGDWVGHRECLETVRIEKSKKMLEEGMPIIDIALKTGFTDQSHFTNLFKSLIGLTPKSYQKVIKEAGNMEGKV